MKKSLVLILLFVLVLSVSLFATGTSRVYSQNLYCTGGTGNIDSYITNTSATTSTNYRATASISSDPTSLVTTGISPLATIRVNRLTTNHYVVINLANISTTVPWTAGDIVHVTMTWIGEATFAGQSTSWDFVIPTGTTGVTVATPVLVPPLPLATSLVAATTPVPADHATLVPLSTTSLSWTYPTGAEITPAVGYRVKFGTTSDLAGDVSTYVATTSFTLPALTSNTHYYWQVIPTDASAKKGINRTDALNCPIWDFTTEDVAPPVQNTIVINAVGPFTYEATNPLNTTGATFSGTVNAPGTLVFGVITGAKAFTYHGFQHVSVVYTVTATDQAMLNGGTLAFNYSPTTPNYVAIHWGGANDGYWPVDHPETAGVPTPGYAFNGAVSASGYQLGMAPFTGSSYAGGVLTIANIPVYLAKAPGTFEIILNGGDFDLPVELSSFSAVATAQMFVNLQWTTESETNNLGFNVFRSEDNNVANASQVNFGIIGGTNSTTTHNYNFVDSSVDPNTQYYYWLQMVNLDGSSSFSNFVMVTTQSPNTPPPTPNTTVLKSAYPNPFGINATTNIAMDVKTGETATLTIYNVLGQTVKTYVRAAGSHLITWNGRDEKGAACGSGIYFYKLTSASVNTTKKMVIVK